jgi:integrase
VKEFFKENEIIKNVGEDRVIQYLKHFEEGRSLSTSKDDFILLGGCWQFFIKRGYTSHNPWKETAAQIKPFKSFQQSPFTKDEIDAILSTAQSNEKYKHYYPLLAFLFNTGCRTGEALGLTWDKLNYPLGINGKKIPISVRIEQALSRKGMKCTKTGKSRTVPIPEKLGTLIESLRTVDTKPSDILFPSKRGKTQSDKNLSAVVWTPLLKDANVSHRKLYNTRHTFVSHALENGISPVNIAKITGHSTKAMFEHYAGSISSVKMPDLI